LRHVKLLSQDPGVRLFCHCGGLHKKLARQSLRYLTQKESHRKYFCEIPPTEEAVEN
jgi:hypothetical protein